MHACYMAFGVRECIKQKKYYRTNFFCISIRVSLALASQTF